MLGNMKYINENEIDNEKLLLTQALDSSLPYDMYYVTFQLKDGSYRQVRVFCEKGTIPDMKTEEYKDLKKKYNSKLKHFFFDRLVGPNSLMLEEGRDDYIYLGGDFLKDGYLANRFIVQSNGKSGQENFDSNLFKLKLQVERIEAEQELENDIDSQDESNSKNKGKHYVISDIHGMYGSYMEVMRRLTPDDTLYILGDVIDRGTEGIKIIQDIMKRQANPESNPQITFLLGNHELQFIDTLKAISEHNATHNNNLTYADVYYGLFGGGKEKVDLIEKGLSLETLDLMALWLYRNCGAYTFATFANKSQKERDAIFNFLINSYVVLPQTINDIDYLLVHSAPPQNLNMLEKMRVTGEGYKYKDVAEKDALYMLEDRSDETYQLGEDFGFWTICGHTPTPDCKVLRGDGFTRIDGGAGFEDNLIMYCIETGKAKYISVKDHEMQYKFHKQDEKYISK